MAEIDLTSAIDFGNVGSGVMNFVWVLFLILGTIVMAVVGYWAFNKFRNKNKFDYQVHIYYQEKDSRMPIFKMDKGGVFMNNKTGLKRFYLFNENIGLNPDNVPFMFNKKGGRIVTLWQSGLKSFRYANVSINSPLAITVGDEDVNWAISTFTEWKHRFQFKSFLEQYGHMILWAVTVLGTMFIFWFVTQKFDVLQGAATALNNAAEALRDANAGTIIR